MVKSFLDSSGILLLQETLIPQNDSDLFDDSDDRFASDSVPATLKDDFYFGRSSGGLAIFFSNLLEAFPKK